MDVGDDRKSGSSRNSMNKGSGGRKLCACRLPEDVFTAWTDKNLGRRKNKISIFLIASGLMKKKSMVGQRRLCLKHEMKPKRKR
ncbi:hypothetical protein DY000_02026835 [Brassica cretica]|uniref:Uncharacterized protein n=1 Tax=Brassica cretica TaxID=69181 RepID=A0ABQ7E2X1_BRACR|nr:hypothetical protein DY000_02026835 [Brassica cretica]